VQNEEVHAAAVCFDLHLPECRSLKEKRSVLRPVVDGIRHRFRVSVAEVDHQDRWQRAGVAVAVVAASDGQLRQLVAAVERFVVAAPGVELLSAEWAHLEPDGVGVWEA
jgi:uncharacterized protein YlxP (DUF503 family)